MTIGVSFGGIKLYPKKAQSMSIIRSMPENPKNPECKINVIEVATCNSFKLLSLTFDKENTFKKCILNVASGI